MQPLFILETTNINVLLSREYNLSTSCTLVGQNRSSCGKTSFLGLHVGVGIESLLGVEFINT